MGEVREMTDRYLMQLWSRAVRAQKGSYCNNPECRRPASGTHHIIKRRYRVLRYDVRNGLPLCSACHPMADRNSAWALSLISEDDREYLAEMGRYTLPEWLQFTGETRAEFLESEAAELKRIIREGE